MKQAVVEVFNELPTYLDKLRWLESMIREDLSAEVATDSVIDIHRATLANEQLQVKFLRDLVEQMRGTYNPGIWTGDSCSDTAEFYHRTAYRYSGHAAYDNDMVIRFIRSITVRPDCFIVHFKGGVCVRIPL